MKNTRMIYQIFTSFLLWILTVPLFGQVNDRYVLDMVHHNPGESLTESVYNDPYFLAGQGYSGQVLNDFTFVHAAITYDRFDKRVFPVGSKEREWVLRARDRVRTNIKNAHAAGIKVYYFTDIIVLPKELVKLYKDEICDENGEISFERPKTIEIHRTMLQEVFETFPDLDGLVIRTGETYLNNVPHHAGNNPITNGVDSHVKLINLLREEVCEKLNKKVFYRTWSFGGMHDNQKYYLDVTNKIAPHSNLLFAIKHTQGDYHRTNNFNPTLAVGQHGQIVEVQSQREYEGKGAFPNYVGEGVINGFEEYQTNYPQKGYKSLEDIKNSSQFKGVWTWSRGGGWVGPYISNEFWIRLNAYVVGHWGRNTDKTESEVFNEFMADAGIKWKSRQAFRELSLLSAKAVIRGHSSVKLPYANEVVWWTRDQFLDGTNPGSKQKDPSKESALLKVFKKWHQQGLLDDAIEEKYQSVALWKQIDSLSNEIDMSNKEDLQYVRVSSRYGLLLHKIIAEGWNIMAMGFKSDETGLYDKDRLAASINKYDQLWEDFRLLKEMNPDCATLYRPYAFAYTPPDYEAETGMGASVNHYRKLIMSMK